MKKNNDFREIDYCGIKFFVKPSRVFDKREKQKRHLIKFNMDKQTKGFFISLAFSLVALVLAVLCLLGRL